MPFLISFLISSSDLPLPPPPPNSEWAAAASAEAGWRSLRSDSQPIPSLPLTGTHGSGGSSAPRSAVEHGPDPAVFSARAQGGNLEIGEPARALLRLWLRFPSPREGGVAVSGSLPASSHPIPPLSLLLRQLPFHPPPPPPPRIIPSLRAFGACVPAAASATFVLAPNNCNGRGAQRWLTCIA